MHQTMPWQTEKNCDSFLQDWANFLQFLFQFATGWSHSFASIGSILKMSALWIFVTTPPALNPETEFAWVATKRERNFGWQKKNWKISFPGILVGSHGCRAGNRSVGEVVIIPSSPTFQCAFLGNRLKGIYIISWYIIVLYLNLHY